MINNPKDILKQWMNAVNAGDIDGILDLYDNNAVLIPTFSNKSLNDPIKIRDYFERLGGYKELSIALHEKTLSIQQIDDAILALSGIYCWRLIVEDELLSFEARFSFLVNLSLDKPIIHHHSSQIPRML